MKRWINTKVVIDIHSGKVVKIEGFWYDGPLALATTPPYMEVTNWAFYNEGTEAGSVIIGSVNEDPTLEADTVFYVRFGLEETAGENSKNTAPQLQYNHEGGGWVNVDATSSVVQAVATDGFVSGDDTTQRITSFTFDPTNQGCDEVDGRSGGGDADLNLTGMEALFSVQILSGDVSASDTIVLKIVDYNNADVDYDKYNQTDPTITVSPGGTLYPRAIAGSLPSQDGVTTRKFTAPRLIEGDGGYSGELLRQLTLGRFIEGDFGGSGDVARGLTLSRAVAGIQSFAGEVYRIFTAPRSVAGAFNMAGEAYRKLIAKRDITGEL